MNFQIAEFKSAYGKSTQIPPSDLPEIVFSGKSNVGKSSLINKLLCRKSMARVSAKPGKTATINFFALQEAYFVDLPGYGYAQVSQAEKRRWAELVEGYFAQERKIALVVQIQKDAAAGAPFRLAGRTERLSGYHSLSLFLSER